jgi:hypothetical protein
MADNPDIRTTLRHFAANIDRWEAEVARIRAETEGGQPVDSELLVRIEDTSGAMYQEIEAFKAAVAEVAKQSPEAAAELASVGEALHLILLEFTELGTGLYGRMNPHP